MSDELYQDLIIFHSRSPKNFGKIQGACEHVRLQNPLCGDEVELFVKFENGKISECRFQGFGCSISKAAASILSDEVVGKNLEELDTMIAAYHKLLTEQNEEVDCESCSCDVGDLVAFSGVKKYPTRIRCATLAVEALAKVLAKYRGSKDSESVPVTADSSIR